MIEPRIDTSRLRPAKQSVMFDAAGTGRRLASWNPPSGESINNAVYRDLGKLRDRSKDVVRKSPHGASARDSFVANSVGTGIKPSPLIADAELRKAKQLLWTDWTDEADADELTDFYGLESMVSGQLFSAGECLVRLRPRFMSDGLAVPLQLQVLAAEHLPLNQNWTQPNGNPVRAGVEFDANLNKRVAYHVYRTHPGDRFSTTNMAELVRVPAGQMLHVFRADEPGQIRGIPMISTVLLKLYELDQYDDAELVRKKLVAMIALLLKRPVPEGMSAEELAEEWGGTAEGSTGTATLEPGTMLPLAPGEEPSPFAPADVGGNYEAFIKVQLHALAAGMGITYEQLTGDLRGVNYSSIRAGLLEFRRRIEAFQHQTLVFKFCRPIWHAWLDAAVMSGALRIPDYGANRRIYRRVKWIPQAWPWVDPLKDRMAELLAVRAGFKSRSDVIEAEGYDPEETEARIKADNDRADQPENGFIFDSDPRRTVKTGALQKAEDGVVADIGKEEGQTA